MLDSIQIKRRLAEGGDFTDAQAEALAEALSTIIEAQLVTGTELEARLRQQTIQILLGVFALNSLFLAAASFLLT